MRTRKLPPEIRRMRSLGKFSAAIAHYAATAERTWRDMAASDHPEAPGLLRELIRAARESIRQLETARAMAMTIGCLLIPDPDWKPDE